VRARLLSGSQTALEGAKDVRVLLATERQAAGRRDRPEAAEQALTGTEPLTPSIR